MKKHVLLVAFCLPLSAFCLPPSAAAQAPPPIAPNLARLDQTINGLNGPGFAIAYNEAAGMLAAACEDSTIQLWHKDVALGVRAGSGTPHVLLAHPGPVVALAWSSGPVLASAGADRQILLWEMPSGKLLQTLPAGTNVRALAMSPDGKVLASGGDDATVQLWDVAAAKPTFKLTGHTDWVLALAFSADGKQLLSGGYDGIVRLWDVAAGTKLLDVPAKPPAQPNMAPPPDNFIHSLAFAPDGKLFAAGGTDSQVHLFSLPDGKYARSMPGHTSSITALAFHPSGTVLVSGSRDRTVRLWAPANGQALKTLEGHTSWVEGVTFLAQGTRLASASADRTVRLWDLTDPAKK